MTRVYLKPGDTVTASFVDLVVIEKPNGKLDYAHNHLGDSELKYFPDEPEGSEEYGCEIKYAWDLDPKDPHYGKPYYKKIRQGDKAYEQKTGKS